MPIYITTILISLMSSSFSDMKITYDYIILKQNQDKYALTIYYELPYTKLVFTKDKEQYLSRYQITTQIWHNKELSSGKVFIKNIYLDSFSDTKKQSTQLDSITTNFIHTSSSKSDNYSAEILISDLNSNYSESVKFTFAIPDKSSRILLRKNNRINPSHNYSTANKESETLNVNIHIYDTNLTCCSLSISNSKESFSALMSEKNLNYDLNPSQVNSINETVNSRIFEFSYPISNFLKSGQYNLSVVGYNNNNITLKTEEQFFIKNPFYFSDNEYLEIVNRLLYIANDSEIKTLKSAPLNLRDSFWNAFWKKYDPNPATEINEAEQEYFTRIDYCIQNYSRGDKGYRSDRAKIYMKYGMPDFIEHRPFERASNAYEIWYYYNINRQFIFVDAHGFGEFILYEEKKI